MPDDNTTNDASEENSENNTSVPQTKDIVLGCDTNTGNDANAINTVYEGLQQAGYNVKKLDIGPSPFSGVGYTSEARGKIGIYLMAASLFSFADGTHDLYDYDIFVIRGDASALVTSQEAFDTAVIPKDSDCNSVCDEFAGMTYPQMNQKAQGKCVAVYGGKTGEEMLQAALNALGGATGGVGSGIVDSGGGTQIKDKTFEKCIRRICAATDSVFLVENNAAVLFPYTDWLAFTLRAKITTIKPNEIDPSVFSMQYNTQGFYNKVTIAWGETELPERTFDTYKQQNKTTTTTNKGKTTQELSVDTDGTTLLSEQYDALVEKYGVLEKRVQSKAQNYETAQYLANALLIQYVRDFNNSCQCRAISNRKYIGGTFYNVTNPFTYEQEMLYLNGYTIRTQKDAPLYFDLDFRYGPESAEDISDYQPSVSGSSGTSGSSSGITGGESADINSLAQQICQGINDDYQKMVAVHEYLRTHVKYDWHECTRYNTPSECLKHIDDLNCADTARLTRALMSAAGLNATVVHGNYHFWTIITINGKEYASDATSSRRGINEVWNQGPFDYHEKNGEAPSC